MQQAQQIREAVLARAVAALMAVRLDQAKQVAIMPEALGEALPEEIRVLWVVVAAEQGARHLLLLAVPGVLALNILRFMARAAAARAAMQVPLRAVELAVTVEDMAAVVVEVELSMKGRGVRAVLLPVVQLF